MVTLLRRLFWLGLIGGAGYAGWSIRQRQAAPAPATAPEWPTTPTRASSPRDGHGSDTAYEVPPNARRWVSPVDGKCPDGYPVKAKDNSQIYHVPGGRFYDRTIPERCYADTDAAEADGYRAAKA